MFDKESPADQQKLNADNLLLTHFIALHSARALSVWLASRISTPDMDKSAYDKKALWVEGVIAAIVVLFFIYIYYKKIIIEDLLNRVAFGL